MTTTKFIIGVIRTDGKIAYLRQNMWAAYKADATRYPTWEAAQELAHHWLDGLPNVREWHVEQTVEG
jgi:hypothetical protein